MPRLRLPIIVVCLLALCAPAAARASLTMQIGAAEDDVRSIDPAQALMKLDLARAAGFDAIRVTSIWTPGQSALDPGEAETLRVTSAAAAVDGISIYATIMPFGSRTTPLTATARRQFALYAADAVRQAPLIRTVIVGNEPNVNRYWLPQYTARGTDAAAPAYEALLARSYDAIKAVDPNEFVVGGSVSPHGSDDPQNVRPTHSPTAFITDLGAAYRASHRTKPIMDGFAFHPYGENSSVPPTNAHLYGTSIGLADYDKLVHLLGAAFDGTAQPGSKLPIVYDEYGIESLIPSGKASLYHGREPASTRPVSMSLQAEYYDEALTMAACQPTVRAMFLFHVADETDLNRWQSGVYYADDTPKPTRAAVRQTIDQIRAGAVDCSTVGHEDDGWVLSDGRPLPLQGPATPSKPRKKRVTYGVWSLARNI